MSQGTPILHGENARESILAVANRTADPQLAGALVITADLMAAGVVNSIRLHSGGDYLDTDDDTSGERTVGQYHAAAAHVEVDTDQPYVAFTLLHELGHAVDYAINQRGFGDICDALSDMLDGASKPSKTVGDVREMSRDERIADAYAVVFDDPEYARQNHPELYRTVQRNLKILLD